MFLVAAEFVLLLLSACFSGAETLLFSLSPTQRERLRARDAKTDERVSRCLDAPAECLATLLVGNTLVNFAVATIGYIIFTSYFPKWGGALSVPVTTLALLLFGEITPKQVALRCQERLVGPSALFVLFWRRVLLPFNVLFRFSSAKLGKAVDRERRALSDSELVSVLEGASERGEFSPGDTEMIEGVLRLSELHANDEMTPRVDMEGLDSDNSDSVRRQILAGAKHRYLPVYRRSRDNIEGVIDRDTGKIEDALFVPEQVTLDDLLVTFRKSKKPLAIVLDEYGGTAGLITPNDIMELILGPGVFFDGGTMSEPLIKRVSSNTWLIDGRASLEEINRTLDIELEAEDADRLAGWVASHAERIAHIGQEIRADGCCATVKKRKGRRVTLVELTVEKRPATDSDEELLAETDEAVEKTEEEKLGI